MPPPSSGLEPPAAIDAGAGLDLSPDLPRADTATPPPADGAAPPVDAPASPDGPSISDARAPDAIAPDVSAPVDLPPGSSTPLMMIPSEWEWENPRPFGDNLHDVWSAGPDDTWAVGDCGAIVHWNGQTWSRQSGQPEDHWWSVWGRAANDLWIVGEHGRIAHHDGTGWRQTPAPTDQRLSAVWGAGGGEVWAVGDGGVILRWNGSAWSAVTSPTTDPLTALAGNGPGDIWATGGPDSRFPVEQRHPTALHYDGQRWTLEPPITQAKDFALLGAYAAGGETWVIGLPGNVLRRSGTGWTPVGMRPSDVVLFGLWGTGPSNLWAVGAGIERWDGQTWLPVMEWAYNPVAVTGTTSDNVWVVGEGGFAWQRRGAVDRQHVSDAGYRSVVEVWASGPDNMWAVGDGGLILQGDGSGWKQRPHKDLGLRAVTGTSATDVWVLGDLGAVHHWDGAAWSDRPLPTRPANYDLWAAGPNDVWAVGYAVRRWNGSAWAEFAPPTPGWFNAVHGSAPNNVWMVGAAGAIRHFDGANWKSYDGFTSVSDLRDVWVKGPNDVWIAGEGGTMRHWNGATFTEILTGTVKDIEHLRGSGNTVWAAAMNDLVLRWDGSAFTHHRACRNLRGIWPLGENDLLAGTYDHGVMRRRNGSAGTRPPDGSGLDPTRMVTSLSTEELGKLCDHSAIQAGGYGAVHPCTKVPWLEAKKSVEACRAAYVRGPSCVATVGQVEECARALNRDRCDRTPLEQPACKAWLSCSP